MAINSGNRQFWHLPVLELVPKLTYWIYYKSIPARSNSGKRKMPELISCDFKHLVIGAIGAPIGGVNPLPVFPPGAIRAGVFCALNARRQKLISVNPASALYDVVGILTDNLVCISYRRGEVPDRRDKRKEHE
jgi:hypothetical protein